VKEQENHKKAFEFYYALGESRSYSLVAKECGVSIGAVKAWGRTFDWRRRVGERDAQSARVIAERGMKNSVERGLRNRKLVEISLMQVAKAIAEGKVKPTVSDLDKLIRLEEFLTEERGAGEQMRLIVDWRGPGDLGEEQDGEEEGPESEGR
jgi:hypothetical protein